LQRRDPRDNLSDAQARALKRSCARTLESAPHTACSRAPHRRALHHPCLARAIERAEARSHRAIASCEPAARTARSRHAPRRTIPDHRPHNA
jgi:hypothetical protein